ncbi:glycosyltransferase family 4 protein [Bacteroides sp. An51A]|uniref:glycosyltransferase family 4 protein n=1 Tax=Bacteroides sp. An51A TaxID=1965640 RepID=UPI00130242DB|nr:glycosyltransferase family 4 protein [Bacteroides sp. An51A]
MKSKAFKVMRISFVILDITRCYGTERTTTLLANKFAEQGHKVSILSVFKEGDRPSFPLNEKVTVDYLIPEPYTHKASVLSIFVQYIKAIIAIRKYYQHNPQDIIIGQAFLVCFFLWMSGYARQAFACEHYKYGLYNRPVRAFRNWMYCRFKKVITLTDCYAQEYKRHGVETTVIPNMLPFPIVDNIHAGNAKKMISAGRLQSEKGYDLLLQALKPVFTKYPDWSIDIYGEGDERAMLEKLRDDLGLLPYVHFLGFSSNIHNAYLEASFYVMSSRHEGFPMVLLEAIACGLPVVSFDCPNGPAALLKDGAGLLVEPENIQALSDAIIRMIEHPELREAYAKKGLQVASEYTPNAIYRKWQTLFME